MDSLSSLRAQIDALDQRWVEILAQRFRLTGEVGRLKQAGNLPAVDAEREASQVGRIRELARLHGLQEEVAIKVLRSVIDEVVANHKRLISNPKEIA
jgi:chorismate mutase